MTRKQTQRALRETIAWLDANTTDSYPGYTDAFKAWRYVFDQALYKAALKYGVAPDSVIHHYEIFKGKGRRWKE